MTTWCCCACGWRTWRQTVGPGDLRKKAKPFLFKFTKFWLFHLEVWHPLLQKFPAPLHTTHWYHLVWLVPCSLPVFPHTHTHTHTLLSGPIQFWPMPCPFSHTLLTGPIQFDWCPVLSQRVFSQAVVGVVVGLGDVEHGKSRLVPNNAELLRLLPELRALHVNSRVSLKQDHAA